eukprot:3054530-Pleurochrysis_carterae.AAC.3
MQCRLGTAAATRCVSLRSGAPRPIRSSSRVARGAVLRGRVRGGSAPPVRSEGAAQPRAKTAPAAAAGVDPLRRHRRGRRGEPRAGDQRALARAHRNTQRLRRRLQGLRVRCAAGAACFQTAAGERLPPSPLPSCSPPAPTGSSHTRARRRSALKLDACCLDTRCWGRHARACWVWEVRLFSCTGLGPHCGARRHGLPFLAARGLPVDAAAAGTQHPRGLGARGCCPRVDSRTRDPWWRLECLKRRSASMAMLGCMLVAWERAAAHSWARASEVVHL